MPFKAQEIDPAGSARARLGAKLRQLRTARRLSQAGLGALIHSSADQVRRVETTDRFPSRKFVDDCDQALQADGQLSALWPAAQAERAQSKAAGGAGEAARFVPESAGTAVMSWADDRTGGAAPWPSKGSLWVTEQHLTTAAGTLSMFRQLDHAHGAGQFAGHLAAYIKHELAALFARPAVSEAVARMRGLLGAEFLQLAGYQAVDSGRPGGAQLYYQRALELAMRSGDRGYGGYLVAVNLGHLALHCEHPDIAARWAQAAEARVGTAVSPATRAAIVAVAARAQARLDDERATTHLLLRAERLLDSVVPQDEPSWMDYFSRAYLADEIAHCLHDLGLAPAARVEVAGALEGVDASHVRRLAIDAALLASTWLRSGDVEQACAVARDAVEYAARTSSGRCVERVARLLSELASCAGLPVVSDLQDYVREVLPAALVARS